MAKNTARELLGAPSYFCEKLAAIVCRDGILEWTAEVEQYEQRHRMQRAEDESDNGAPMIVARQGVAVPVLLLASGSSIFEEAVFRGVLLHGLITRARMRPWLASLLSSAVFGIAHVGNEGDQLRKAVYAAWTFAGGMIFSGAYIATRGGCFVPTLLHFGLNALIFSDSASKVARKVRAEREEMRRVAARESAASSSTSHPEPGAIKSQGIGHFNRMQTMSIHV